MTRFLLGMAIVLPFLCLVGFGKKLERIKKDRVLSKMLDTNDIVIELSIGILKLKPSRIRLELEKNTVNTDWKIKQFMEAYKKAFNLLITYLIGLLIAPAVCVGIAFVLFYKRPSNIEHTIILLTFAFEINWILCWSPVLHSVKEIRACNNLANIIDQIVYDVFTINGKTYQILLQVLIDSVVLIFNMVVLGAYIKCIQKFRPDKSQMDFLMLFATLFVYRYLIGPVIAFFIFHINEILRVKCKLFIKRSKLFFNRIIKNNTYLLFLITFVILKATELETDPQYGLRLVEAIGLLFLTDVYIDNFMSEVNSRLSNNNGPHEN